MVDHHTLIDMFWDWYHDELNYRKYCPVSVSVASLILLVCFNLVPHATTVFFYFYLNFYSQWQTNWKWVIPPMSSSTNKAYLGLNKVNILRKNNCFSV